MDFVLHAFKVISIIFALSAVATGVHALVGPVSFSRSFRLPLKSISTAGEMRIQDDAVTSRATVILIHNYSLAKSYISLMGVRQLAMGVIILTFAYQNKFLEIATILAIIGTIIAGTDGMYLLHAGAWGPGLFHAIPGAIIAALAWAFIYSST